MTVLLNLAIFLNLEDGFFDWMWKHAPHILIFLLLVVAAIWVTSRVKDYHFRFKLTEDKCDDLRNTYVPDLNSKFTGIDKKLNLVLTTVQKISMYLITAQGLDSKIFEVKSPLQLTPLGNKILETSGGKKYVDDHLSELLQALEAKLPKSGLDVQNYSNSVLAERTIDDDFTHIENYVFQNPVYKIGEDSSINIEMGMTLQIMGIYLRNKYFEKYPDLQKDVT